jgi:LAO/AO transport system kinase
VSVAVEVPELVAGLERGERRALARLLTVVEDGDPARLREVIAAIFPKTGRARVIGVTGSPGVGKSTLTDQLATHLRAQGRSVAILAVDPSSPFSGGALLGDRVRMQGHHADPHVFIRSMASRGHLGGLSFATPQAVLLLDAAGFDDILVETVGVGQSEVEIAATADTTIVSLAPGMGDGIQAAKAGILEVADVFVINKADRGGAGQLESELRGMLEMGHALAEPAEAADAVDAADPTSPADDHEVADTADGSGWWPPIVRTVAVRAEGIEDLVTALDRHLDHLDASGLRHRRRRDRALHTVREIALEAVRRRFSGLDSGDDVLLAELAGQVADRELDPYRAADRLLEALDASA